MNKDGNYRLNVSFDGLVTDFGWVSLNKKRETICGDYFDIIETNYPAFTVPRGFKCRNNREINDTHTNLTTSIYCSKPSSITSPVESKRTELRALR